MTNPVDIIANAIRVTRTTLHVGSGQIAEVAAAALTDDRIVANAVQALLDDGWRHAHEGPNGQSELSDEDLTNIARTVLGSVGGDNR